MPRTSKKNEATTAAEGISVVLDTRVLKTVSEGAEFVGCAEIRLLELFCDALKLPKALGWETIPQEHEHLLNEFKAQASANTQVLPEAVEVASEAPLLEEEPVGKITSKRKTSGITNKRKKSIGKQLENIETIDLGIDNAEALNLVRDAAADGVELGQAQVLAKESARLSVRRKAYERTTAKLKEKAVKRADYDPTDLLKQAGLQISDDLLEDLQEFSEVSLGKFQTVFEEVTGDVWGNGYTNDFSSLDEQLDWSE